MERVELNLPIMGFDEDEWQKQKERWREQIDNIKIKDNGPGQVSEVEAQIDEAYTEASYYYMRFKTCFKKVQAYIDFLKDFHKDNDGNNADERKAKSYQMLAEYPLDDDPFEPETINLYTLREKYRERYNFFKDYVMDNLEQKQSRLSNIIGAGKVDARIAPRTG